MSDALRIAIIGCGLIGKKRAAALSGAQLVAVCDVDQDRATALAATVPGCEAFTDVADMLKVRPDVVVVATANNTLTPLSIQAVQAGAHVLVEKPAAISVQELDQLGGRSRQGRTHGARRLQSPLPPRAAQGTRAGGFWRRRGADVFARTLRSRRTSRL